MTKVWKKCLPSGPKKFWDPIFFSFCPTYIWGKSILQKTAFNLVKYGLQSPTYDLHLHIGGRHSVLYFSIQATEKYSTAMYYVSATPRFTSSPVLYRCPSPPEDPRARTWSLRGTSGEVRCQRTRTCEARHHSLLFGRLVPSSNITEIHLIFTTSVEVGWKEGSQAWCCTYMNLAAAQERRQKIEKFLRLGSRQSLSWRARISDEAIFHQTDNSRILKLWLCPSRAHPIN